MHRTQIHLTRRHRKALSRLAAITGRTLDELIHEALERFFESRRDHPPERSITALRAGRGLWENRHDLPDLAELRGEWERFTERESRN